MSKSFIASNPCYCVIAGAPSTNIADIDKAVKGIFASARKMGRNPVLVGINGNPCSEVAATIAEEQKVPTMFGTPADITKDLDSRRLRKDHIQVVLFQDPEYAGSLEALDILYGCRQFGGTLRMWSNFHSAWLNSQWNRSWVREFNDKFLKTLNSYSLSNEEKCAKFAERIFYLQRFPVGALFNRKTA